MNLHLLTLTDSQPYHISLSPRPWQTTSLCAAVKIDGRGGLLHVRAIRRVCRRLPAFVDRREP